MHCLNAHLGIAEIAELDQGPRAADQKRVLQLDIPVCHTLQGSHACDWQVQQKFVYNSWEQQKCVVSM